MNLYIRSVGFRGYSSEDEDTLVHRAMSAAIKSGKIIENEVYSRGIILYGTSESTGIAVYGRLRGEKFIYDTHFPYIVPEKSRKEKEIVIFRSTTGEKFQGALELSEKDLIRVFFISNPIDMLSEMDMQLKAAGIGYELEGSSAVKQIALKEVSLSYTGFALAASVLLPAYNESEEDVTFAKQKKGSSAVKDAPTEKTKKTAPPIISTYQRTENEDILSIVDSYIFPGGTESESYVIVGKILSIKEETNIITDQRIYIMSLQAGEEHLEVAVNADDVVGVPKVGRRLNARIWLHGYIS